MLPKPIEQVGKRLRLWGRSWNSRRLRRRMRPIWGSGIAPGSFAQILISETACSVKAGENRLFTDIQEIL
jgi:hypothetical protein